ncbi:MAG: hypothetical protein VW268_14230 [Rhodospirillaceae bacterium]
MTADLRAVHATAAEPVTITLRIDAIDDQEQKRHVCPYRMASYSGN